MPDFKLKFDSRYDKELPRYLKHEDFISGDNSHVAKYLTRHEVEKTSQKLTRDGQSLGAVLYNGRLARLANDNFTDMVLSIWLGQFTSQELTFSESIDTDAEPWSAILADVTGEDKPFKKFYREIVSEYLTSGVVAVATEGPSEIASTIEDSRIRNERSFSSIIPAKYLPFFSRFTDEGPKRGQLSEVVIIIDPHVDGEKTFMQVRRFWIEEQGGLYKSAVYRALKEGDIFGAINGTSSSASQWQHEREFELVEKELQGAFDFIPIAVLGTGMEESILKDVVAKNYEHLNKKSVADSVDYYQGFTKVAAIGVEPEELDAFHEALVAAIANPDARFESIPPGDSSGLWERVDAAKKEGILSGLLQFNTLIQLATKNVQSAESKVLDQQYFEAFLDDVAELVEQALSRVMYHHFRFESSQEPAEELSVSIGRDFQVVITDAESNDFYALYSILADFGEAGFEAKKEMAKSRFAKIRLIPGNKGKDDEVKQKVLEALDSAKFERSQFRPSFSIGQQLANDVQESDRNGTPAIPAESGRPA